MAEIAGNEHGEVDCRAAAIHWTGMMTTAELPLVPVVGEHGGDDGDDLGDGFELAEIAGLDGEPFRRSDGTQDADEELAADDDDDDPDLDDLGGCRPRGR